MIGGHRFTNGKSWAERFTQNLGLNDSGKAALDAEELGIKDTVNPCLSFGVHSGAICDDPDERMFWDGVHPGTVVHNTLGDAATALFKGE